MRTTTVARRRSLDSYIYVLPILARRSWVRSFCLVTMAAPSTACCIELEPDQRAVFQRYVCHPLSEQPARSVDGLFRLVPTGDEASPFKLGIGFGCHSWLHEGHVFKVDLREEGTPCGDAPSYFTRLRVSGENSDALQSFLSTALTFRVPAPPGKIWTYAASRFGQWRETGFLPAQSLEDLFLPEQEISGLLAHVNGFLENGERYARAGRVHKLCLLFVGVPGAGKSSLVRALGLQYRRELYSLSLPGLSDAVCNELVSTMGTDGILLVEDFDSLGFSLSTNRKRSRDEDRVSVSRSGFLNLLDGNGSPPKGTIICLTANSSNGFDQALVRAGRVDRIVSFGPPKEPEVLAALRRLTEASENREESFIAFCAKLKKPKKGSFCMASLVDYLFRHPSDYLEKFEELHKTCVDRAALVAEGDHSMFS